MRHIEQASRLTLVAASCVLLLSACGGGGGGGNGGEGRLQVIDFQYPGGNTLLNGPTTLQATATSGLPVEFSTGTPQTCTVSGDQLTLVGAGECLVYAHQAGGQGADGTQWAAAADVSQLFNVLKHAQTVSFTPPDYVLSAQASEVTLSATSSSGLPVTFAVDTPNVCSITGSTLKLLGKGSCAVTATQGGDANYAPQATQRFVAVDPLLVADGFEAGGGRGSTNSMRTKQGGGVSVNAWDSPLGGWEWCDASNGDWCYQEVSADGKTMTSALHVPDTKYTGGWQYGFNRIDIFAPGLTAYSSSGDTVSGLQVTTEQVLVFTLGVNSDLYTAAKPIVVNLGLGKRNGDCNVMLSTQLWPVAAGDVSYAIPLANFAVTNACGLAGVTAASLDNDVRQLPSPWGTDAADTATKTAAYLAKLETFKPARDSAAELLKTSNIVQFQARLMDVNVTVKSGGLYGSDMKISGAITLQ